MSGQQHQIELKLYGIMYERLGAAGSIPAVHHDFGRVTTDWLFIDFVVFTLRIVFSFFHIVDGQQCCLI